MTDDLTRPGLDRRTLERQIRARRLWYHDVEVCDGLRTRFPEDGNHNPVLERVDRSVAHLSTRLSRALGDDLSGRNVLDLGCADGGFSIRAARCGADRVVGIERNRQVCDRATFLAGVLGLEQVSFRCGSLETACPDEAFDIILFLGLVYHLISPLTVLHRLRRQCGQTLVITSALDLPDDGGEPLCRMDRYATGAHGFWSYNAPMIRQMITTAGFETTHEEIDDLGRGNRHYFAVAIPGQFASHHIFSDTVDEEFPINLDARRAKVREVWAKRVQGVRKPVAIFGSGTHTSWLLEQVADLGGRRVECVLDDRVSVAEAPSGLPVRRPTEVCPEAFGAVVVSSWHQSSAIEQRAVSVFGDRVPIITFHG